jgi:hypothetical protein
MNNKNGTRYTKEYKEAAIARMMPPNNIVHACAKKTKQPTIQPIVLKHN